MNLKKFVNHFKLSRVKRALGIKECLAKVDLGVLKVALMVAALDGEVMEAEYKAFDLLAKKCRGYTPKLANEALHAAMRSAGYLMLLSKRVKKTRDLVAAFMVEARAALPDGFAYLSIREIRQAVITWIMMGMSDGDYSDRERACIEALRKFFAELKGLRIQQDEARWAELSHDFGIPLFSSPMTSSSGTVQLITKDFVSRVEDLVSQYGDSAEAARELEKLVG